MWRIITTVLAVFALLWRGSVSTCVTQRAISWTGGALDIPCPLTMGLLRKAGQCSRENVVATKIGISHEELFVMTPKFKPGVPATLSKLVSKSDARCAPALAPFPSLEEHEEGRCSSIQNAVDLHIDSRGVIWVLDSGTVDTHEFPRCTCPPKVVAMSAQTGETVHSVDLARVSDGQSDLQRLVVDYSGDVQPFVYIADGGSGALLVTEAATGLGYRVALPSDVDCRPAEARAPELFLALMNATTAPALLVSFGQSGRIYSIDTSFLRSKRTEGNFRILGVKPAPMVFLGTDAESAVYFKYRDSSSVLVWDTQLALSTATPKVIYHGEPCCLVAESVALDAARAELVILETNIEDFENDAAGSGVFHRITRVPYNDGAVTRYEDQYSKDFLDSGVCPNYSLLYG